MSNDEILAIHKQRLEILELQAAKFGDFVPPYIKIEINDLKRKIADLDPTLPKRQAKPHNIWVVDAFHRGDFVTINEAIAAASDGDEIRIKPGVYEESLHITKVLEILGDGNRDEIEIRSSTDDVIKFEAKNGRIAHLKVRQLGATDSCIYVEQGQVIIENCDINGGLQCIVTTQKTLVSIRSSLIHGSHQFGLAIYDSSEVVVKDSDIFDNAVGVFVVEPSSVTIMRNYIRENTYGIIIRTNGLIENNDIFSSEDTAISVSLGAKPNVRNNRLTNNKKGISISHKSGGWFINNQLYNQESDNWHIEPSCLPNVIREGNIEE